VVFAAESTILSAQRFSADVKGRAEKLGRSRDHLKILPGAFDDFVDKVIPELQRRGIFRREYEGTTLRENLGLPRPSNRYFPA
jgi:alkanesulfonate monooxygenase SsuD/methylene tetrahydromethanopterin reductase-like flavin-dependent oxidoreductase (luciferase family)